MKKHTRTVTEMICQNISTANEEVLIMQKSQPTSSLSPRPASCTTSFTPNDHCSAPAEPPPSVACFLWLCARARKNGSKNALERNISDTSLPLPAGWGAAVDSSNLDSAPRATFCSGCPSPPDRQSANHRHTAIGIGDARTVGVGSATVAGESLSPEPFVVFGADRAAGRMRCMRHQDAISWYRQPPLVDGAPPLNAASRFSRPSKRASCSALSCEKKKKRAAKQSERARWGRCYTRRVYLAQAS